VKVRFIVRPCDNCGSVEGLVRDRTWVVIRKLGGEECVVADVPTRAQAYAISREAAVSWPLTTAMRTAEEVKP
jgi:hypothetical protein